jgi:HAMP domain-containing protein
LADVVESIGVTNTWAALGAALGAIFLLAWFLKGFRPAGLRGSNLLLQMIETRGRRASLSQFQIVLWMFVIGAATAYVMVLSGNLIPLTEGTLAVSRPSAHSSRPAARQTRQRRLQSRAGET